MLQKICISNKCCSFEPSIHWRILKSITVCTKILCSTTAFKSSKSAYYNDFWRIMWHWRLE